MGNQLDTGAKARALPPLTKLGVIASVKADSTFRNVTFPIPASLLADNDRLVAEVRILRD